MFPPVGLYHELFTARCVRLIKLGFTVVLTLAKRPESHRDPRDDEVLSERTLIDLQHILCSMLQGLSKW